jgi:hypothetical protein
MSYAPLPGTGLTQNRVVQMAYPQFTQFICEIPECGKSTMVQRFADCTIWLDQDHNGNLLQMNVCPEHKAKFLRLVSNFVEGK